MSKNARGRNTSNTEPKASSGIADEAFDLPVVDEDTILSGAAADATDLEEKFTRLPRILRVALLIDRRNADIRDRLVADIETLCPGLLPDRGVRDRRRPNHGPGPGQGARPARRRR